MICHVDNIGQWHYLQPNYTIEIIVFGNRVTILLKGSFPKLE